MLATSMILRANAQWAPDFYIGAGNKTIRALALTRGGTLVAGGDFLSYGGAVSSGGIARWSGADWSGIGGGIRSGSLIAAILPVGDEIYAGGTFTSIGGKAVKNLARWDGINWSDLGGGVTASGSSQGALRAGVVRALAWKEGELFVGGTFTGAGGYPVSCVASWNGTEWNEMAGGVHQEPVFIGPNTQVNALLIVGSDLYVGGSFSSAGGIAATNIARWDGQSWHSVGEGLENGVTSHSQLEPVSALVSDPEGSLYVGGSFDAAGSASASFVAKWDGTAWSALGTGLLRASGGSVLALHFSGHNLYASGSFNVAGDLPITGLAQWDGTNWAKVPAPIEVGASGIAGDGTNLFVSGQARSQGPATTPVSTVIARFDGVRWSTMGAGINDQAGAVRAIAPFASEIFAGGNFNRQYLAAWDGWNWALPATVNSVGPPGTPVTFALAADANNLYAAGQFSFFDTIEAHNVVRYTGTRFYPLAEGLPSPGRSLALRGAELFAGHLLGIARWDGEHWLPLGDGLSGEVRAIALDETNVFAGGTFTNSGPTPLNFVARWDGERWRNLGNGLGGPVNALAVFEQVLYAGGDFPSVDGLPAERLAKWDGAHWEPIGNGFMMGSGLTVSTLALAADGSLYVGGTLRTLQQPPMTGIAKWDGSTWRYLSPRSGGVRGVPYGVMALSIRNADLFVGGEFSPVPPEIDPMPDNYSARFAQWHIQDPLLCPTVTVTNLVSNGASLAYRFNVLNPGSSTQSCIARITLPAGTILASAPVGALVQDRTIIWNLGALEGGGQRELKLDVAVQTIAPLVALTDFSVTGSDGKVYRATPAFTTISPSLAFRFTRATIQADRMILSLEVPIGRKVTLQTSSDLLTWKDLKAFVLSNDLSDIAIPLEPADSARFARGVLAP